MRIREATSADAAAVMALFERLYSETKSLLYEPGESVPAVQEYARRISEHTKAENGIMCVTQMNGELVGVIFGNRVTARKTRHSLFLVMGVLQSHWNQGIGRSLLEAVEVWARPRGLHRLELTVQTGNSRAIALYEKVGFVHEGTKRHSLKVEGQYIDELFMSELIAA